MIIKSPYRHLRTCRDPLSILKVLFTYQICISYDSLEKLFLYVHNAMNYVLIRFMLTKIGTNENGNPIFALLFF